jgi:hypothetical protein
MSLSVAYRHESLPEQQPVKAIKTRGKSARDIRVERWQARQYEKDYQDALKFYAERIAKIQEQYPGWLPPKD